MILPVLGLVAIGCSAAGIPQIHSANVIYDLDAPPSPTSTTTTRPKPVIYLSTDTVMPGDELTVCGEHFGDLFRVMETLPVLRFVVKDSPRDVWDTQEIHLGSDGSWCRTVVVPNRIRSTDSDQEHILSAGQYRVVVVRSDSQWNAPLAETTLKVEVKNHTLFTEPSQSPEDARRDQVIQRLAEMPVSERVGYLVETETSQGLWVLSTPYPLYGQQDWIYSGQENCIGICDRNLDPRRYGIDFIYLSEYSEILLMDPTGTKILRAYPMPGYPAYEMIVTDNAVFTGTSADGAGCPSLLRIDRKSLELEAYAFPKEYECGELHCLPDTLLEGWKTFVGRVGPIRNPDYTYDPVALEEFFASVD